MEQTQSIAINGVGKFGLVELFGRLLSTFIAATDPRRLVHIKQFADCFFYTYCKQFEVEVLLLLVLLRAIV